jgi:tRNA(Ile)-lysidine synthase
LRIFGEKDLPIRFASFAKKEGLILPGDRILAAHSGGSDSTFLFEMLLRSWERLGFEFVVGHVNHGLRGKAADEDEAFVKRRCAEEDIHFLRRSVSVEELSKREGLSVEMAARRLRYHALEEMAVEAGCNKVAFAHQSDDRVETFLLRLLKSAGPDSLASIPLQRPMGSIELIRPLFAFRRKEIMEWLRSEGVEFRTDETNLDPSIARNAVREELLPLLEDRFNPSVRDAILRAIDALESDSVFINRLAEEEGKVRFKEEPEGFGIDLSGMDEESTPIIIRLMLIAFTNLAGEEYRLNYEHLMGAVRLWLEGERNDHLDFPEGWSVFRSRDGLLIRQHPTYESPPILGISPDIDERPLIDEGEVSLPKIFRLVGKIRARDEIADMKHPPQNTVYLKANLAGKLRADYSHSGRDIKPLGMSGHTRKVSDVLMEAGTERHRREWVPVLVEESDANQVAAIPHLGLIAESVKVEDDDTEVFEVRVMPSLEEGIP